MPKRLLLADDSLTIHRVVELTFADEDFEVISVSNGTQALEKINLLRPDIVIADVNMPEKDGYEVCAYVKNSPQFATIPVLLLKGTFEPFNQEKAETVRADGIIQKPFQSQALIDKVNNILGVVQASISEQKAFDKSIAEKTTQPQPPFIPKQAQQPIPSMPQRPGYQQFSAKPVQVPPFPRPQTGIPPKGEAQIGIPASREPFEIPAPQKPQPSPVEPHIKPEPMKPQPPISPRHPADIPGIKAQPLSPERMTPTEAKPLEAPQSVPMIDDSPFGFSSPMMPKSPEGPLKPEDQLSRDAFEAGKELYQTFGKPAEVSESQISPFAQDVPMREGEQVWDFPGSAAETKLETRSPDVISEPKPEAAGAHPLDFSDAMGDVSMVFNSLATEGEIQPGVSPVSQKEPSIQTPQGSSVEQTQWAAAGIESAAVQKTEADYVTEIAAATIAPSVPGAGKIDEPAPTIFESNIPSLRDIGIQSKIQAEPGKPSKGKMFEQLKELAAEPLKQVAPEPLKPVPATELDAIAEKVASKIIEKISTEAIKEIAWELVPGIIDRILKDKIGGPK